MHKLSTTTICKVPLKDLLPDPDQPRTTFDKGAMQALVDNIKERGIQVPIQVRIRSVAKKSGKGWDNEIVIKDGERRWRAAKQLKLKHVPVLLAHTGDAAQIRIDQVSLNNLTERLRPMELAQTIAKMHLVDKLSLNDIAARFSKQGTNLSQAQVANLLKLVDLPTWAQAMVNEEKIEVSIAREIAGIADKAVLPKLQKRISDALDWRGRVTVSEAARCITAAYEDVAAADLKETNSWNSNPVLFDYRKTCKGCPHLRETHGGAFCMDEAGFKKHQAEAKEAGLGPGGLKPEKKAAKATDREPTPAQQKKLETQKAEQRAKSLEDKSREYLHAWARGYLTLHMKPESDSSQMRLIIFAAACFPGIPSYERGPAHMQGRAEKGLREIAAKHDVPTLQHILKSQNLSDSLFADMAKQIVAGLPLTETLQLMHHLHGADLSTLWFVDGDYLDLLQKAELIEVAGRHAQLPEGRKSWAALKTDEITAAILAAAAKVGVPPTLARLYSEVEPRDTEQNDGSDDDFDDDQDDEE